MAPPARLLTTSKLVPKTNRIYGENALLKATQLCQEMCKLKDEHIMVLKTEMKNLPALILSQLQEQLQPT